MKFSFSRFNVWCLGLIMGLSVFSCKEEPIDLLPEDLPPAITILSPSNNNLLREKSEPFTITLQLADNEALKLLRIAGEIYNQKDSLVSEFTVPDMLVSGTNATVDYTDTVPDATEAYFKVKYTCYALDAKGDYASTFFWVSVLPDPTDPSPYVVLSYTGDSIRNDQQSMGFAFNFTAREGLPSATNNNELDFDIAESSNSARLVFKPQLISPNNTKAGQDSVFVMTNSSKFNFESATYETLFRAYFSDPAPYSKTPELKAGDYVIVRLTKSPQPQFAIMKINEVVNDGAGILINDRVKFDYKVTSQQ